MMATKEQKKEVKKLIKQLKNLNSYGKIKIISTNKTEEDSIIQHTVRKSTITNISFCEFE